MIDGETGTGKEIIAQFIHNHGPARRHKFIPISHYHKRCVGLPRNHYSGHRFNRSRKELLAFFNLQLRHDSRGEKGLWKMQHGD